MQANVEQIEQDIQNFKKQLKIERNLSEHTLRAYECDLHCMLRWIETHHIRALNDKVTMSYFNYLQDEEHLGARSIRRKYVSLRQFFEFLGETYDVHEKFFRFSSRKFQVPKTLPKTLERSEIQRLLSAASKNFQAAGTEYLYSLLQTSGISFFIFLPFLLRKTAFPFFLLLLTFPVHLT
mgnify:CR=1 FL=1|jgi:integrase/recombinase XerD